MTARGILKLFKSHKWLKTGRWKEPVILEECVTYGVVNRRLSSHLPLFPSYYCAIDHHQFVLKKDFELHVQETKTRILRRNRGLVQKISRQLFANCKKLAEFRLEPLSKAKLSRYLNLVALRGRQWYEITLIDPALQELYPASLPQKFSLGRATYTSQTLFAKACLSKKIFPMVRENYDILKIAIKLKKGGNVSADLRRHAHKYGWTNSLAWWNEPFGVGHYQKEANMLAKGDPRKQLRKLQGERRQQYREAEKLLTQVKKQYPQAYLYLDIIRDLADLKEENWDVVSIAGARFRPLFSELAKSQGLSYEQLMAMRFEEMIYLLNSDRMIVKKEKLNERLRQPLVFSSQSGTEVLSGPITAKALRILEGEVKVYKELKGLPIWLGKKTGRARVMFSVDDVPKIKEGEILICPMTDPDYLPAIKKARAVVTDQGGFLCHAAIVARELRKVCLVGTKVATKVFKDGDVVEVDADRGVVRKI